MGLIFNSTFLDVPGNYKAYGLRRATGCLFGYIAVIYGIKSCVGAADDSTVFKLTAFCSQRSGVRYIIVLLSPNFMRMRFYIFIVLYVSFYVHDIRSVEVDINLIIIIITYADDPRYMFWIRVCCRVQLMRANL